MLIIHITHCHQNTLGNSAPDLRGVVAEIMKLSFIIIKTKYTISIILTSISRPVKNHIHLLPVLRRHPLHDLLIKCGIAPLLRQTQQIPGIVDQIIF